MLYLEYFPPPVVFVRPQWEPGSVLCVLHLSVLGEKQGFSELITGPFLRSRSLRVMRLLNALFYLILTAIIYRVWAYLIQLVTGKHNLD